MPRQAESPRGCAVFKIPHLKQSVEHVGSTPELNKNVIE